jgi:hypothetical protein
MSMKIIAVLFALVSTAGAVEAPVVLELFTSQGCSSCPDADALLSSWGMRLFQEGRALPLAFNVDYWNYLGWKDVFSEPAYSGRQRRYASALGVRTYTPQLVVAGREALVGSDASSAQAALARQSATGPSRVRVSAPASSRARLKVEVAAGGPGARVMLALFENGLWTDVTSGENKGQRLRSDFVVRRLVDLGPLPDGKPFRRHVDEAWDPSWNKASSGAAVFLQDPRTLAISDAAWVFPLSR